GITHANACLCGRFHRRTRIVTRAWRFTAMRLPWTQRGMVRNRLLSLKHPPTMRVRVLFFGMLKDFVGRPAEDCDFPPGSSLGAVFDEYARRYPRLQGLAKSIVIARNQEFAAPSTSLEEGDEVAFLPPVSGGVALDLPSISENGHYFA